MCNRGYAYINFTHPIFLLDFYLEFQGLRWNQHFRNCNSQKTCVLHYANIQGKEANMAMLANKNIMKKIEDNVRPILKQRSPPTIQQIEKIKAEFNDRLAKNPEFVRYVSNISSVTVESANQSFVEYPDDTPNEGSFFNSQEFK